MKLTLSEGLLTLKTLKARHAELVQLRNENAHAETRFYGRDSERQVERQPLYDVKKLDKLVSQVARETRVLESAIKSANATTVLESYDWNDAVLGEVE